MTLTTVWIYYKLFLCSHILKFYEWCIFPFLIPPPQGYLWALLLESFYYIKLQFLWANRGIMSKYSQDILPGYVPSSIVCTSSHVRLLALSMISWAYLVKFVGVHTWNSREDIQGFFSHSLTSKYRGSACHHMTSMSPAFSLSQNT